MQPTPHDGRTSVPVLDAACKVELLPAWAICPFGAPDGLPRAKMQNAPIGIINLASAQIHKRPLFAARRAG
jgi:hypothetical protein